MFFCNNQVSLDIILLKKNISTPFILLDSTLWETSQPIEYMVKLIPQHTYVCLTNVNYMLKFLVYICRNLTAWKLTESSNILLNNKNNVFSLYSLSFTNSTNNIVKHLREQQEVK